MEAILCRMKFSTFSVLLTELLLLTILSSRVCSQEVNAQECDAPKPDNQTCQELMKQGHCNSDQAYMFENCQTECLESNYLGSIGYFPNNSAHPVEDECVDLDDNCGDFAEDLQCNHNPDYMIENCAKTCKFCFEKGETSFEIGIGQQIPTEHMGNTELIAKTLEIIQATAEYMAETVMTEEEFGQIRYECINTDQHCAALAAEGACEESDEYVELLEDGGDLQEFMMTECAPACQTCDELITTEDDLILEDCKADYTTNALEENGGLDEMFMRIVRELPYGDDVDRTHMPDYEVNVLSRPMRKEDALRDADSLDYHVGPWVVTLDNFLTDEECDRLIELGALEGYERSYLNDQEELSEEEWKLKDEEEDAYRTSTNSWCKDECYRDPTSIKVRDRIENLTGVPSAYSEHLQMLKYVPGQYYKEHHDFINDEEHATRGPRIITVFLYLNEAEEGGATRFNDLNYDKDQDNEDSNDTAEDREKKEIDVHPKKGRALIWPSVLNDDLHKMDSRTYHEARMVTKGVKYGANAWLHLRNVQEDPCNHDEYERIMEERALALEEDYYDEEEDEYYDEEEDFETRLQSGDNNDFLEEDEEE